MSEHEAINFGIDFCIGILSPRFGMWLAFTDCMIVIAKYHGWFS